MFSPQTGRAGRGSGGVGCVPYFLISGQHACAKGAAPPPRSQTQPATVGGQKREGRVRKRRGLRFSTAGAANKERDRQRERPSTWQLLTAELPLSVGLSWPQTDTLSPSLSHTHTHTKHNDRSTLALDCQTVLLTVWQKHTHYMCVCVCVEEELLYNKCVTIWMQCFCVLAFLRISSDGPYVCRFKVCPPVSSCVVTGHKRQEATGVKEELRRKGKKNTPLLPPPPLHPVCLLTLCCHSWLTVPGQLWKWPLP